MGGEKAVSLLPRQSRESPGEGGHGLRHGLDLREWRGSGVLVALGSREAGDPTS